MASKKLFAFNAGTTPKEDAPGLQNSESADDFVFDDNSKFQIGKKNEDSEEISEI